MIKIKISQSLKSYFVFIVKMVITLLIILSFVQGINNNFLKVSDKLTPSFIASRVTVDREKVMSKAYSDNLKFLMPSFGYLANSSEKQASFDKSKFEQAVVYYERMIKYFPRTPDAYGLLGYCFFQLSRFAEVADELKKAAYLAPDFFWHKYNLGIYYYSQGNYEETLRVMRHIIQLDPELSLTHLEKSSVYLQMIGKQDEGWLRAHLGSGYFNAHLIVLLSHFHLKKYDGMIEAAKRFNESSLQGKEVAYCYSGIALFEQEQYPQSVDAFKECMKAGWHTYEGYDYLSRALEILGTDQELQDRLKQVESVIESRQKILSFGEKIGMRLF